ncbi:hypothetical protein AgCh_013727 [Apium graveolens]
MAPSGGNGSNPSTDDNQESSTMLRQIANTQAEMTRRSVESLVNVVTRLTETMVQNRTRDHELPLRGAQRQQGTNVRTTQRQQGFVENSSDEELEDLLQRPTTRNVPYKRNSISTPSEESEPTLTSCSKEKVIIRNQQPAKPYHPRNINGIGTSKSANVNPYAPSGVDKCYRCGEPGHKSNQCPRRARVGLATHDEDDNYDIPNEVDEDEDEITYEDQGISLVSRKLLYTPQHELYNQKHNIFTTKCTVKDRVCDLIIDSGNSDNIVSSLMVKNLNLPTENHPNPYSLGWIRDVGEVKVTQRCQVSFSIGKYYKDVVYCDVVDMNACHMLLGRPWQYDVDVVHNGRENTYTFFKDGVKIILGPNKGERRQKTSPRVKHNFLISNNIIKEAKETGKLYALVIKGETPGSAKYPSKVQPIIDEFASLVPDELPESLPPVRDIQHHIDL